ncbi:MAG: hypothetical protein R3C14_54310 [Caldilineaceae bacterium]
MTVKQKLADLWAELNERAASAERKRAHRVDLAKGISGLRAAQQLDGVDHSKRIAKLENEIADIDGWLATWPDVETELHQRIETANEELRQAGRAELLAELDGLLVDERAQRLAFAEQAVQLVGVSNVLQRTLERKEVLRHAIRETGNGVDVGDPHPPMFSHKWLGNADGVHQAQAVLDGVRALV